MVSETIFKYTGALVEDYIVVIANKVGSVSMLVLMFVLVFAVFSMLVLVN